MNTITTAPITPGTRVTVTTRSGQVTGTVDSRDFGPSGYSLSIALDNACAHLTASGTIRAGEEQATPIEPLGTWTELADSDNLSLAWTVTNRCGSDQDAYEASVAYREAINEALPSGFSLTANDVFTGPAEADLRVIEHVVLGVDLDQIITDLTEQENA